MTTDTSTKPPSFEHSATLVETLRMGVIVWASEMKWLATSLLRRFEISRLAKRLEEEYTRLGTVAEAPRGKKQEKDLCLKQISFLKEEIQTLRDDLEAKRMQRVNELRSRQGSAPVAGSSEDDAKS